MFHPKALFVAFAWLGASLSAFGQSNYVVELSGPNGSSGQYFPYCVGPSSPNCSAVASSALVPATASAGTGPAGINQIIAKPDGSGFYLIGTSGVYLQLVGPNFVPLQAISAGFASKPTAAALTPNGQFLLIAADKLYALSTSSEAITWSVALQAPNTTGIAVSRNSAYAYLVSQSGVVEEHNVTSGALVGSTITTGSAATGITLSPVNLLYVTAGNGIYEINPANLAITAPQNSNAPGATIQLYFQPGPLRFTPDGTVAYSASVNAGSGGSLLKITLSNYAFSTSEYASYHGSAIPQFTDVYVASSTEVFALAPSTGTLWDVNTTSTPVTAVPDTQLPTSATQNLVAIALSNEVQSNSPTSCVNQTTCVGAQTMFLLSAGAAPTISEVSLVSDTLVSQTQAGSSTGLLQFATVPPQTGNGSETFLILNNQQLLEPDQISAPLTARVLTSSGVPIYNLGVTFSTPSSSNSPGPTITTPSQTTDINGYVQTTVTAPTLPGTYTITLTTSDNTTANNGVAQFTVTVLGSGGSGGTGGTGGTGGSGGASSQVTSVSGDGQLIFEGTQTTFETFPNPMTLLVTDTSGNPLANVPVTFNINGPGSLVGSSLSATPASFSGSSLSTATDKNGLAYADFQAPLTIGNVDNTLTSIVATTQYGSVAFQITTFNANIIQGQVFDTPQLTVLAPSENTNPAYLVNLVQGVPTANAIEVEFQSTFINDGAPIQGISLYTYDPNSQSLSPGGIGYIAPVASCQGSTYSDQNGVAHCTLVTTCSAGTGLFPVNISAGGYTDYFMNIKITSSGPTKVAIVGGNNQTGAPGQTLPGNLIVTVTDACGKPVTGQTVSWAVTKGSAQLKNILLNGVTNGLGQSTAQLQLGSTAGSVQVTASVNTTSGTTSAVFTFTNQLNITVGSITATSGNGQSATVGQAFAQPVVFTVLDTNNNPVSGATVSLTVTPSGSASIITPNGVVTNALGQVSVSVTAGSTAQTITITGATASVSGSATLTASPVAPSITPSSFANAASGAVGLVPCGLSTVTGNGVAPNVTGIISGINPVGPLSYTLGGFSMTVNGIPAPIQAISNQNGVQQVNFQTPCEVAPGSATVVLTVNGVTTTITGVQINQVEPGIFYYTGPNGKPYGVVISAADGSYVTPSNYAVRGGKYFLLVTGLGQATPTLVSNNTGQNQTVNLNTVVGVSNAGVAVISAEYSPGLVGVYAVEFQIPTTTATGAPWPTGPDQPLAIYAILPNGQQVFGNGTFLPGIQ